MISNLLKHHVYLDLAKKKKEKEKVLLYIINNSIWHQTFVYTQSNDQTILFQGIQFSISFVCSQFKRQTVLFDPLIGLCEVLLLLQAREDLGVMAMKMYSRSLTIKLFKVISEHSLEEGSITPGQSGSGSDGNEGVLHIPQNPASLEPQLQIV